MNREYDSRDSSTQEMSQLPISDRDRDIETSSHHTGGGRFSTYDADLPQGGCARCRVKCYRGCYGDTGFLAYMKPIIEAVTIILVAVIVQHEVSLTQKNQRNGLWAGLLVGLLSWFVFSVVVKLCYYSERAWARICSSAILSLTFIIFLSLFIAIMTCNPNKHTCDLRDLVPDGVL